MSADLSEDLKRVIDQYLDGHRSRSLATLARVSGVAYTTLRRFAQREGHPTAEPVLKIVDAALFGSEKLDFISRHFPEIARTIDRYSKQTQQIEESIGETLKLFYTRDPHNYVLNLAVTAKGTSADDVQRLCGERGLAALDEMVESGVLERDFLTGRVSYPEDTLVSLDADIILSCIKHSVSYFDRSLIGTKAAKLGHVTATVNEEGLRRIHDLASDLFNQIHAVKHDARFTGKIPFFIDLMMNVLDKSPLSETRGRGSSKETLDA